MGYMLAYRFVSSANISENYQFPALKYDLKKKQLKKIFKKVKEEVIGVVEVRSNYKHLL